MTNSAIEAELLREGYKCSQGTIPAETHAQLHTHAVDIKLHVLEGSLTLEYPDERRSFGPGEVCVVPAGTFHAEHTGADPVTYMAGKRAPAGSSAAE